MKSVMYMGTPKIAIPSLEMLTTLYSDATITVISRPDAPVGRGKKVRPSEVKQWAIDKKLTTYTPESKQALAELVEQLSPDLIVVMAYGMIIPKSITDNYFCINSHASILPQYRGASPIQASLLNNDPETGITLIRMNEKMDEGDILAIQTVPITQTDNYSSLTDKLQTLAAETLHTFLANDYANQTVKASPQSNEAASYCKKISKDDLQLDLSNDISISLGKIRAFSPKPGAYIMHNDKRLKLLAATVEENQLVPTTVQPEGKQAMPYSAYLNGQPKGTSPPC
jgi:methionyl-tRNA formyltransferase